MAKAILGIVLPLLACVGGWAQGPVDSWDNLKELRVAQKIEVVDMNLKSVKGTFVRQSAEAITLRTDNAEVAIARGDVLRVSSREGSKRMRNALIGVGVGTAAGLAAGFGLMERETGYAGAVAGTAVLGAGVGAGVGAVLPVGTRTIYRAPQRRPEAQR
jgi:hypothetical protein